MDLQLGGRTALVTGSSKGIGRAIATMLAREGAHVVVHGRERPTVDQTVDEIRTAGGVAHAVLGDLTDEAAVRTLIAEAEAAVGGELQIVVNNAGGSGPKDDWGSTATGGWASTYDRNVLATVRVCTRVLPGMRRSGWGRIINISSVAGRMPPATGPDYAAAKAAINALTASMAKAVAADGVTVNAVSPGMIRSDRLDAAFRTAAADHHLAAADAPWEEVQRAALPLFGSIPAGRVGELDELAGVVAFLASPRAGYVNGVNLPVDGAFSALA